MKLQLRLDAAGRIDSLVFDRWGDPDNTGTFAQHQFGGEFTGYRSYQGLTIPSQGRLGWFYGEDGWPAGEFFRYQITDLQPTASPAPTLDGDRMSLRKSSGKAPATCEVLALTGDDEPTSS